MRDPIDPDRTFERLWRLGFTSPMIARQLGITVAEAVVIRKRVFPKSGTKGGGRAHLKPKADDGAKQSTMKNAQR